MTFAFQASARAAEVRGERVHVTVAQAGAERREECDVPPVAGAAALHDGLGLDAVGVAVDAKGRVVVDAHYQTNVPGVYAIGDVIPGVMLAHKAEEEGIAAVERMAGQPGHVSYSCVPNVVHVAGAGGVGMTEEQAVSEGRAVNVGVFPFLANGRARAMEAKDGQVKLIADAATDRLLSGQHIRPSAMT